MKKISINAGVISILLLAPVVVDAAGRKPAPNSIMSASADAFGQRFNAASGRAGFPTRFGAAICDTADGMRTCKFSAQDGVTAETIANGGKRVTDIQISATKHPLAGEEVGRRIAIEALSTMAMIAWPTRGPEWARIVENIVSDAASSGVRGSYKLDGVELSFRVERSDEFRIFAR